MGVQVKKDGREAEEASKHAKIVEDKSEKDKKTADKVKSSNMQFEMRMEVTTSQIDELEKGKLERVNKKLVDEKDSAAIAQLNADKKQVVKKIDDLKKVYDNEKQKENGEKDQFREKDMKANKGAEKTMKEEQKKRQDKFKEQWIKRRPSS